MSLSSPQIGHLLFELDQLHAQAITHPSSAETLDEARRRIEKQIQRDCSKQERARLMRMSRAYRQLASNR